MEALITALTALLYLLAAAWNVYDLRAGSATVLRDKRVITLHLAALAGHGHVAIMAIIGGDSLNFSLLQVASLIAWFIAVIAVFSSLRRPNRSLLVPILPLAALLMLSGAVFGHRYTILSDVSGGLLLHITAATLAYSVLAVAAVQAVIMGLQISRLRDHRMGGLLRMLPPLQTMESTLFDLISAGFLLLTAGLLSGALFVSDFFAQHLVHKAAFTLLSWLLFATLLWGHHRRGWRGRTAVRWTLWGFAMLLLAYVGSGVVLEYILRR